MFINGLGRLAPQSRALLERVLLGERGVRTRHLALARLEDAFEINPDVLYDRFLAHAPELAARAARTALGRAGLGPRDVDAVIISTCTGWLCPGLTSHVAERLGLRPDALALDLVGQGCGAALPNLAAADALVAAGRCEHVLSVCVEVCSAALYLDDDPGVLVSACLFGDGAAAVASAAPRAGGRSVEWHPHRRRPDQRRYLMNVLRSVLAASLIGLTSNSISQSTEPRGSIPPGTSQAGSRPADGAIKGGAILPGETGGVPEKMNSRCYELEGSLREDCLKAERDAAAGGGTAGPRILEKPIGPRERSPERAD